MRVLRHHQGRKKAEIIHETGHLISFLDHRPLFRGHTLLVPKIHVRLLSDLPADRVGEFFLEAQRLERAVETGLGAAGSMILINNVVSQSVPHLHLHVIPRNRKDGLRFWLGPRHPYDAPPGQCLRREDQGRPAGRLSRPPRWPGLELIGMMSGTVLAGDPSLQVGQEGHVAGDTGSVVNPGVGVGATRAVGSLAAPSRRALAAHLAERRPG